MARSNGYREWLVGRLRYVIDQRGKSVATLEKELGRGRGWLADALRGGKRLPIETVLEVLDHLECDPADFFAGLTPDDERWARYPRGDREEPLPGAVADSERARTRESAPDLRRLVGAVIRVLERKGVLEHEDLLTELSRRR